MKMLRRFVDSFLLASFMFSALAYGSATGLTPFAGTWKYKATTVQADGKYTSASSMTVKDNGDSWTATTTYETPDGTVTDVVTLEKGTLFLRGESFKHFAKPGRPWSVTILLKFSDSKATGSSNRGTGQDKPIEVDLSGPMISEAMIGFLPLADGYSTTVRTWDVQTMKERHLLVKVLGMENVTVAAGRFDAFKVELTPAAGGSNKETVWIAKDSRMTVKASEVEGAGSGSSATNSELVP
jgi:hypothetical protein